MGLPTGAFWLHTRPKKFSNSYSQFGLRGRAPGGVTGELSPASVYVSLLPVVEACVVVAVPGRVGEVRVAADEPEAVDLDPGVLARRLDAPATVKAVLEQGGRVLLRSRAVRDPGPSGGRVRGVAKQIEINLIGTVNSGCCVTEG